MFMKYNEEFVPAWKQVGLSSKAEGFKMVSDYLFSHKDNIINLGFSPEVLFLLGDTGFILKGKNVGRKKDMGQKKS